MYGLIVSPDYLLSGLWFVEIVVSLGLGVIKVGGRSGGYGQDVLELSNEYG
jgi:hypothetical protein